MDLKTKTSEAEAKAKAWNDKMKVVLAKEAAEQAKEALDKQTKEELEQAAKAQEEPMDIVVKDQKGVNLLGMMAQQVGHSV